MFYGIYFIFGFLCLPKHKNTYQKQNGKDALLVGFRWALTNLIYKLWVFNDSRGLTQPMMLTFGLLILSMAPKTFMTERREFVSKVALAAIPFSSALYGMARGKYNYQVINHSLYFEDLPEAFHGFKLTHISDIHSGSFEDETKIVAGIDLINEQESDLILFTGDLVNNTADEMIPWISHFGKLKAKHGKYSVLGNHDYGEYVRFNSEKEKAQILRR